MAGTAHVEAPNGHVYELDEVTASGLIGSKGSGWKLVEAPADETKSAAKAPAKSRSRSIKAKAPAAKSAAEPAVEATAEEPAAAPEAETPQE